MRKKTWLGPVAVAFALVILALAGVAYDRSYPVEADNSNLLEEVCRYYSRGTRQEAEQNYRFYDMVDVGEQRFVLMEYREDLGVLYLRRGLNGRYRLEGRSYGDGNFRNEVVEDEGRYCLIFGGRNSLFRIHSVTFSLGGREYSVEVPQKKRFFLSVELEGNPGTSHVLPGYQVWFYDADGTDITETVEWNGH